MRKGGGIGFVLLAIVMVVVLLLVARSWKSLGPTAIQVTNGGDSGVVVPDHGDSQAGAAVASGNLPGLNEMQEETDAHAQQVQEALAATD